MLDNTYDLHIQSNYSGEGPTVKEIVARAQHLQFQTICISDKLTSKEAFAKRADELKEILTTVKVLQGVVIEAKNSNDLKKQIDLWRDVADLIIVAGGSVEVNRSAAENPKVDILAFPEKERKDSGIDDVIAKAAAKNKVAIQLNFSEYLRTFKKIRSYVLSHMRRNVMLCQQYEAPVIVCSGASSVWEMRTARDLSSLAFLVGMDKEKAIRTTSDTPDMLTKNVIGRKDKNFVRPGVRIIEE